MTCSTELLARVNNKVTKFGAFLDSVLDRYSDAFLFLSVAWYLASKGEHNAAFLSLGTLVGAFLISYAKGKGRGVRGRLQDRHHGKAGENYTFDIRCNDRMVCSDSLDYVRAYACDGFAEDLSCVEEDEVTLGITDDYFLSAR